MVRLFFKCVRARWFEFLAAVLVIAVVVSTVIVQHSLAISAENEIHDLAHRLGDNILVLSEKVELSDFYMLRFGDDSMPESYPRLALSSSIGQQIKGMVSRLYGNWEVQGVPLIVVGQSGITRAFPTDKSSAAASVWGDRAAKELSLNQGDIITIGNVNLEVSFIAEGLTDDMDLGIFTELEVAQRIFGRPETINAIHVSGCWCSIDIPALARQVEDVLPGTRAIAAEAILASQVQSQKSVQRYSKVLELVAILLVGGIIAALISSQVRRQVREIGLFLAVGAQPFIITGYFIVLAALVGLIGGLTGFLLGSPITEHLASQLVGRPLAVSNGILLPLVASATAASIAASFFPAHRAATVDPTTALREI